MTYFMMILITGILINICLPYMKRQMLGAVCIFGYEFRFKREFFIAIVTLPMFLLLALQYAVHSDYDNYIKMFYQVQFGKSNIEIGYRLINKMTAMLNLDFQWIYVIMYGISFILLVKCLLPYSEDIFLSLLLLFFVFFEIVFMQIRQLAAVLICMSAFHLIAEKKMWRYFLAVLIACSFHKSAVIMLPMYFFLSYDFKFTYYLMVGGALFGLGIFSNRWIPFLLGKFMPERVGWFQMYKSNPIGKWQSLFLLLMLIIVILYYDRIKEMYAFNRILLNAFLLRIIIFLCGNWIPENRRFGFYFYLPITILIPNLLAREKNKYLKSLLSFIVCASVFVVFWMQYGGGELLNYKSIFSRIG